VGHRRVLLARLWSGEVVAASPVCPHEGAPLAEGTIRDDAIDCPRHHYLFDLRTGRNLYPYPIYPRWKQEEVGRLHLRTFPCREEDGWILVTPPGPGWEALRLPATAAEEAD
jgi:nitrite reductase/ring-hydroxylating ferredoxin subunit